MVIDGDVEVTIQMVGVAVAPSNIVGQAFIRQVGSWDREKTTCLVRPGGPAGIRALVTVGG